MTSMDHVSWQLSAVLRVQFHHDLVPVIECVFSFDLQGLFIETTSVKM